MTEAHGSERRRIAVAIATFRRPDSLAKLLSMLGDRAAELPHAYETIAIVVDNDPNASARPLVTQSIWGVPVRYAHEPSPGIAAARSRLLVEAKDQQLLVFIDDDEWPLPGWLSELVHMWERTGAAGVLGRVETVLPEETSPWVVAFGIFQQADRVPGQHLVAAPTNNLLLDLDQVRALGLDFDLSLGLRGGEDTLFTRQMTDLGATIVACPSSVVRDDLEPNRATREFVLQRARYHGITQADIDLRLAPNQVWRGLSRAQSTVKSVVWLMRGLVRGGSGLVTGSTEAGASGARMLQRSIGLLLGAWTHPRGEYTRDSGDTSSDK